MKKNILLVNTCIYDFAAFNLWSRPLGLLYIAGILKKLDFDIKVIDALSPDHENDFSAYNKNVVPSRKKSFATYQYYKEEVPKPEVYKSIKRKYYRFGISPGFLRQLTSEIIKPDLILVTSQMTYWYKGVFEFIGVLKEIYPDVKIILGGAYAKLCHEHAVKFSMADYVFKSSITELMQLISVLLKDNGIYEKYKKIFHADRDILLQVLPHFGCYSDNEFLPFLTSTGCFYWCKYCASRLLFPEFAEKSINEMIYELNFYLNNYNVKNISFYDDALLINKEKRIIPFLEYVINNKIYINFHTPNGLHINSIDSRIAMLFKQSGFKTLRLGFESYISKFQKDSDRKTDNKSFEKALKDLLNAGFSKKDIGIYILMGLPHQSVKDVIRTINFIKNFDVACRLCEYSPIPGTSYFKEAAELSNADLAGEPLLQNNTALELRSPVFNESVIKELKDLAR